MTNELELLNWLKQGDRFRFKKEFDEAIRCYNQALKIEPKDASAWHNLGLAYNEKGNLNEAIICYKQALEFDPKQAYTWYNLGFAYYCNENYQEAINSYDKALDSKSDHLDALASKALACFMLYEKQTAKVLIAKVLKQKPNDPFALLAQSLVYYAELQEEAAHQTLQRVNDCLLSEMNIDGKIELYYMGAKSFIHLKKYDLANDYIQKALLLKADYFPIIKLLIQSTSLGVISHYLIDNVSNAELKAQQAETNQINAERIGYLEQTLEYERANYEQLNQGVKELIAIIEQQKLTIEKINKKVEKKDELIKEQAEKLKEASSTRDLHTKNKDKSATRIKEADNLAPASPFYSKIPKENNKNKKLSDTDKIQSERVNAKGEFDCLKVCGPLTQNIVHNGDNLHFITAEYWTIALVRKKPHITKFDFMNHMFLLLEGIENDAHVAIRIDLFSTDSRIKGKNCIIKINLINNLSRLKQLNEECYCRVHGISKTKVTQLLEIISEDQAAAQRGEIIYNLFGNKTSSSKDGNKVVHEHSSTSWCLEKWQQIGLHLERKWIDFIAVIPEVYLPEPKAEAKQLTNCLIM